VRQCLRAAGELAADGIAARIIDLYSVKPADQATLQAAASATGGRLVIAEDRYPQGDLGAAVLEALAVTGLPLRVRKCAAGGLPRLREHRTCSWKPPEYPRPESPTPAGRW
jgi:transketolase